MFDNLYQRIRKCKNNDKEELSSLINEFDRVISKYSRKLAYEDAKHDMIIEFIQIINKIPIDDIKFKKDEKYIMSYITTSLKNNFLKLKSKHYKYSELKILDELDLILEGEDDENINDCIVYDYFKALSTKERKVVEEIVFNCKSIKEISEYLHISRQAVNKIKIKAFDKLRKGI